MPLVSSKLKAEMKIRIYNGLVREFSGDVAKASGFPPIANDVWMRLANAISDAAFDIVNDIQNDAEVQPGIPSTPTKTVGIGKIK